jgi:uncharacterized protein (TIGR02145 family)
MKRIIVLFSGTALFLAGCSKEITPTDTNTFIDTRDNHIYKYVEIGLQTWMAENLAWLPSVSPSAYGSETMPYYYVYNNEGSNANTAKANSNFSTYGVLYNWKAATTACPTGWHLPSDYEWKVMEIFLGFSRAAADSLGWRYTGFIGGMLKETGTGHWNSPNSGASNSSGFTARPGGGRYINGAYDSQRNYALFWTASAYDATSSWMRYLGYYNVGIYRYYNYNRGDAFSVRCIKDNQ